MTRYAHWLVAKRTEELVLELRELLVRFDENAAAHILMRDCIPHYLENSRRLHAAAAVQLAQTGHLADAEAYRAYYADNPHERPFEEQFPGVEIENAHEHIQRLAVLRDWLAEQGAGRLLDLACNDGWLVANLAGAGVVGDGLDLAGACIARARKRLDVGHVFIRGAAEECATHFRAGTYDAVVCFELVEHVAEPERLVREAVRMLRPGGHLYLSTPNGTTHQGDLPDWDRPESKGHLRVYTPTTIADLISRHADVRRIAVVDGAPGAPMIVEAQKAT